MALRSSPRKRDPGAALIAGHHWMIVVCRSRDTVGDLDLRVKRRPPEATILMTLRDVRYPRCNGHGRPEILRLAQGASRTSTWGLR